MSLAGNCWIYIYTIHRNQRSIWAWLAWMLWKNNDRTSLIWKGAYLVFSTLSNAYLVLPGFFRWLTWGSFAAASLPVLICFYCTLCAHSLHAKRVTRVQKRLPSRLLRGSCQRKSISWQHEDNQPMQIVVQFDLKSSSIKAVFCETLTRN